MTKHEPYTSCVCEQAVCKEPVYVYSGALCDLNGISTDPSALGGLGTVAVVGSLIDLPLSAAADTLILPWSIYQHYHYRHLAPPPDDVQQTHQHTSTDR